MADLDIVHPKISEYLEKTFQEQDPILREMGDHGRKIGFPIIGAQSGRLLAFLAKTINAKNVLELGSGFGYSAMLFAQAMGEGSKVIMTEGKQSNQDLAREYFTRAGLLDRVDFNVGDALEIAKKYPGPFDIIFCDIDKHDYPKAIAIAKEKLRVGGILIYDNMLWHGRIIDQHDADTNAVLDTTQALLKDDEFFTALVPLRDGQTISLRVK